MLVTLKENLSNAEEGNFAVGAFNSPTLETARAVIVAAEELHVPVILSHAEVHNVVNPIEVIGPVLVEFAKKARVPVTVHLDHGSTLENVKKAIDLGFSSVMIDASHMHYEDNIKVVKEIVNYAKQFEISVEAELGMMTSSGIGGEETASGTDEVSVGTDLYTDPIVAKDFVDRTEIDALAASFGTVHGIYISEPYLDIERLKSIFKNIQRPVVMHGGSGLEKQDYINVINAGVRKINYYSYAAKAGALAVKEYIQKEPNLFYHDLTVIAREAIKKDVKRAMDIFSNK
ncbi:class II fructose-bisphosphate aldolase [Salipaludibacillus sp. HK11]|uniref:class II fructose-bisphosphate aldolase n=1 Tax=Salipaludibacillus sp. HK11 TaxID=3394320 RepID=UPI0039FC3A9E